MEAEQTQVVDTADLDRTQVGSPVAADATQAAIRIVCPVCQTTNPPGERWCQDCGFLLSAVPGEAPAEIPTNGTAPRLVASGDGGREHPLNPGPNSVGRENTDIVVLDATVSRRHATITLEDGTATVVDLGSTNGTRVAGQPVPPNEPRPLYDGDEIQFGNAVFTLALPGASPRPEEADAPSIPVEEEQTVLARLVAADGTELPIRQGPNTIGRRSENDVVVRGDPYVSGRHAEIHCDEEACVLVDVGSTNGTFLRGERLAAGDRHDLRAGDEVRLGQSVFLFEQVASPSGVSEPAEPEETDTSSNSSEHEMEDEG
jgi:pSer/pThr/pTyr-binding forkhead associated (FHA) protein